jgi:hypothetical protein
MTISVLVVMTASAFVIVSCSILALHKDYQTGLLGGIALALIAVAGFVRLMKFIEHDNFNISIPPAVFWMWVGLALHFGQLLYRFFKRLRCRDTWYIEQSIRRHGNAG